VLFEFIVCVHVLCVQWRYSYHFIPVVLFRGLRLINLGLLLLMQLSGWVFCQLQGIAILLSPYYIPVTDFQCQKSAEWSTKKCTILNLSQLINTY